MPSNIPLNDFRRWFARFGISIESGGKHLKMRGTRKGKEIVFPLPLVNGREVKHWVLGKARKRFFLTEDDGVTDKEFFG